MILANDLVVRMAVIVRTERGVKLEYRLGRVDNLTVFDSMCVIDINNIKFCLNFSL